MHTHACSRLRQLDFSKNQLTGSIPPSWSGLGSASSGVSGVPQQWPVNYLVLKSNRLTGTLPPWLPAAFPNLQARACSFFLAVLCCGN